MTSDEAVSKALAKIIVYGVVGVLFGSLIYRGTHNSSLSVAGALTYLALIEKK